jgi:hypothetical protein
VYNCIVVTVLTPQPRKPHTCNSILVACLFIIIPTTIPMSPKWSLLFRFSKVCEFIITLENYLSRPHCLLDLITVITLDEEQIL